MAGLMGACALNAVTYLDMAVRGRPASATPEETVRRLAALTGLPLGEETEACHRAQGLGALLGILAGSAGGAAVGLACGLGWRPGRVGRVAAATAVGMCVGNVPMTVLGVSDPRQWTAGDWLADLLPHVAYGFATAVGLRAVRAGQGRS